MRILLLVSALLMVGSLTAPGSAPASADAMGPDLTPCEVAAAWVAENVDALPTSYDTFAAYTHLYRKHIYHSSPLEVKQALWEEHIDRFLAHRTDLTPAQVRFVEWVKSRSDELIAAESPNVSDMAAAANVVLGQTLASEAFYRLGGPIGDGEPGVADAAVVDGEACSCHKETETLASASEFDAQFIGDCPGAYVCQTDGDGCDLIEDDCGWLGTQLCDGECLSIQ